CHQWSSYPTF
nr:immunoglobulin light chain junction region [Mus musculus]NSM00221.1 immunoglobulin light chain junction region [Mus musculus]